MGLSIWHWKTYRKSGGFSNDLNFKFGHLSGIGKPAEHPRSFVFGSFATIINSVYGLFPSFSWTSRINTEKRVKFGEKLNFRNHSWTQILKSCSGSITSSWFRTRLPVSALYKKWKFSIIVKLQVYFTIEAVKYQKIEKLSFLIHFRHLLIERLWQKYESRRMMELVLHKLR